MWWANIKGSRFFNIIIFDILLIVVLLSSIETQTIQGLFYSSKIPKIQGDFIGDYFYDYNWENTTLDQWDLTDDSQYEDYFFLNNGTDDIWVRIITENNFTISYSGDIKYFTFEIFEDGDNSVLKNWEDNMSEFSSIDWQGYQNYYWDSYSGGWMEYDNSQLNEPIEYLGNDWGDSNSSEENATDEWDSLIYGNEGYQDYFEAYNIMHESLTGDESWWFLNIYYEIWNNFYNGTVNYTWLYDDTGEQFDPNSVDLQPVEGYERDWEWAQSMRSNQTLNDSYSWTWFSYDLNQWVSWNDIVSESVNFISTVTTYTGMSIFKDLNKNGIVDATYGYDEEFGNVYYKQNQSEIESYINFDSIEDIEFYFNPDLNTLLNPDTSSQDLSFKISLKGVNLTTIPYGYGYDVLSVDDGYSSNNTSQYYINNINLTFFYEPHEGSEDKSKEKSSTFSIKQDLSEFQYQNNHSSAINKFNGKSLTIDYSVNSAVFSSIVSLDESVSSFGFESQGVDGEVNINSENNTLMSMNLTQKYKWGKDGKDYINNVVLIPIYGFGLNYGNMEIGMASVYNNQLAPYSYSLCFENWGGYSISMDPTFTSYYTYMIPRFNVPIFLFYIVIPLAVLFGIVMSKQEYRVFLLNRVMKIETGAHRLTMEDVLENENRSRIIDLIVDNPGIHFSELLRQTKIAPGNLNWHIEILDRYKIIKSEIVGKYVMYFPYYDKNPLSNIDLKLQKSKTTMDVLQIIQTTPGLSQNQIARQIERNHKTVKYHLDKLIEAGLIEKQIEGKKKLLYPTIDEPE